MKWIVVLAALAVATPALAAAPQPKKPVAVSVYSGRWYEIARTPNLGQGDCQAASNDFTGWSAGAFNVVQTCHKGSAAGPVETHNGKARIVAGSANAKLKMTFMGGMLTQEYWILDHADDNGWAIMGTPGGHYVWVLARRPVLDAAARTLVLQRVRALGFDLSRLTFPQPAR